MFEHSPNFPDPNGFYPQNFFRNFLTILVPMETLRISPVPGCEGEDRNALRTGVLRHPGAPVVAADWERDPVERCPSGSRDPSPRRPSPPVRLYVFWHRRRRRLHHRPPHRPGHLSPMHRVRCCRPPFLGSPTASAKSTIDFTTSNKAQVSVQYIAVKNIPYHAIKYFELNTWSIFIKIQIFVSFCCDHVTILEICDEEEIMESIHITFLNIFFKYFLFKYFPLYNFMRLIF